METIIDFISHDINTSIELSARSRTDKNKIDFEFIVSYSKELFDVNGTTVTPQLVEKIKTKIDSSRYIIKDIDYRESEGDYGDKIHEFTVKGSLKEG